MSMAGLSMVNLIGPEATFDVAILSIVSRQPFIVSKRKRALK